jgi:hypothetical protein
MPVGFPTKTTYANGDVFSADDINSTNGTINLLTSSTLSNQAGKNVVINGGFDIWQRGTSISLAASTSYTSAFSADRWTSGTNANQACTISRQATSDTTNLPSIQYCMRFQRNNGQTGTTAIFLTSSFETSNSIPFVGKTATMSFYARRGANYSPTSNLLTAAIQVGTGIDQNANVYTSSSSISSTNFTLTTTWQRFTLTGTIPTTATEMAALFSYTPTGTAGAADFFEITGVQIELGSTATTFSRAGGDIQGELSKCQRYYTSLLSGNELTVCMAANDNATGAIGVIPFPVTMRTTPTLVATSGTGYYAFIRNGGSDAFNSLTLYAATLNATQVYNNTEISGTAGQGGLFRTQNALASVAISAEL